MRLGAYDPHGLGRPAALRHGLAILQGPTGIRRLVVGKHAILTGFIRVVSTMRTL